MILSLYYCYIAMNNNEYYFNIDKINIIFNFNTNYYHRINNSIIEEKIQNLAFILIKLIDNHLDRIYR